MTLAEFVVNNIVNVAKGYGPFYLNSGDYPLVPSVLIHGECVSNQIKAI